MSDAVCLSRHAAARPKVEPQDTSPDSRVVHGAGWVILDESRVATAPTTSVSGDAVFTTTAASPERPLAVAAVMTRPLPATPEKTSARAALASLPGCNTSIQSPTSRPVVTNPLMMATPDRLPSEGTASTG